MKIIIDIPEKVYEKAKIIELNTTYEEEYFKQIILDGIILPKGYGKLIDADKVIKNAAKWGQDNPDPYIKRRNSDIIEILNAEEAVIEADNKM